MRTYPVPLAQPVPFLTLNDLTKLGYSRSSWYELARQGKIKLRKLGGKTIVLQDDLSRFLNELPELHEPDSAA